VRPHFEKLQGGNAFFSAFERVAPVFPFQWHYHPEYELTLIVTGSGQRLVGDSISDYGPGDLVLLGPNLPHSWRSAPLQARLKGLNRAVVVHFRPDFLGERFLTLQEMTQVARLFQQAAHGLAFDRTSSRLDIARKLIHLPALPPPRRLISLLGILVDLAEARRARRLATVRLKPICRIGDQQRIEKICAYLEAHFDHKTNFAQLAAQIPMDQTSLCRFFKRATGRTLTTYVNELRIGTASELLTHTDLSVLEIALRVGFDNYSYFCRRFRSVKGCAPRMLRKQFSG
jgi:AraC-like DNA-binding protein